MTRPSTWACWLSSLFLLWLCAGQITHCPPGERCEINPAQVEDDFIKGVTLQLEGMSSLAAAKFRKVLEVHPDHIGALYNLGFVYAEMEQVEKAEELIKKASRIQHEMTIDLVRLEKKVEQMEGGDGGASSTRPFSSSFTAPSSRTGPAASPDLSAAAASGSEKMGVEGLGPMGLQDIFKDGVLGHVEKHTVGSMSVGDPASARVPRSNDNEHAAGEASSTVGEGLSDRPRRTQPGVQTTMLWETPLFVRDFVDSYPLTRALTGLVLNLMEDSQAEGINTKKSALGGWQSHRDFLNNQTNFFIENKPMMKALQKAVLRTIVEGVKEWAGRLTSTSPDELVVNVELQSSWANVNKQHHANGVHHHPNALVSGVYYLDVGSSSPGDNDGGKLWLLDPRRTLDASLADDNVQTIRPSAGRIVLFPGWLDHAVVPHLGDTPRVSVAFNALVTIAPPDTESNVKMSKNPLPVSDATLTPWGTPLTLVDTRNFQEEEAVATLVREAITHSAAGVHASVDVGASGSPSHGGVDVGPYCWRSPLSSLQEIVDLAESGSSMPLVKAINGVLPSVEVLLNKVLDEEENLSMEHVPRPNRAGALLQLQVCHPGQTDLVSLSKEQRNAVGNPRLEGVWFLTTTNSTRSGRLCIHDPRAQSDMVDTNVNQIFGFGANYCFERVAGHSYVHPWFVRATYETNLSEEPTVSIHWLM